VVSNPTVALAPLITSVASTPCVGSATLGTETRHRTVTGSVCTVGHPAFLTDGGLSRDQEAPPSFVVKKSPVTSNDSAGGIPDAANPRVSETNTIGMSKGTESSDSVVAVGQS
jgi:hypothetical protein